MTARDEILRALPGLRARLGRKTFTPAEVIAELQRNGTALAASTIRTHVLSRMCANAPDNRALVYDDLQRVGPGLNRQTQGHR